MYNEMINLLIPWNKISDRHRYNSSLSNDIDHCCMFDHILTYQYILYILNTTFQLNIKSMNPKLQTDKIIIFKKSGSYESHCFTNLSNKFCKSLCYPTFLLYPTYDIKNRSTSTQWHVNYYMNNINDYDSECTFKYIIDSDTDDSYVYKCPDKSNITKSKKSVNMMRQVTITLVPDKNSNTSKFVKNYV